MDARAGASVHSVPGNGRECHNFDVMREDDLQADDSGSLRFDWHDEKSSKERRRAVLKRWILAIAVYPALVILGVVFKFFAMVGLGAGLLVYTWTTILKDRKSKTGPGRTSSAATSVLTDERLQILRDEHVLIDVSWSELTGFTYSARSKPALTLHRKAKDGDVTIKLHVAETHSSGFWATIDELERRLPLRSSRTYDEPPDFASIEDTRKNGLLMVFCSLTTLIVSIGLLAMFFGEDSESFVGPLLLFTATVSLAVFVSGFAVLRRSRAPKLTEVAPEVWGDELARFEPDRTPIGSARGGMWALFILGSLWTAVGAIEFSGLWYFLALGVVCLLLGARSMHMLRLENQAIVITDQYIYVKAGRHTYNGRHGAYDILAGSLVAGFRIPFPRHAAILLLDRPVAVLNRAGKQGMVFSWLCRLNDDVDEFLVAQVPDEDR